MSPAPSALTIGRAEDMGVGWQHHFVEGLGEHRRREEGDGAQRVAPQVCEVVPHIRRNQRAFSRNYRDLRVRFVGLNAFISAVLE